MNETDKASREALSALKAIADGYPYKIENGFIIVQNPKFQEDNGENPYLVIEQAATNAPQMVGEAITNCQYHAEILKDVMSGGFSKEEQTLMLQNLLTAVDALAATPSRCEGDWAEMLDKKVAEQHSKIFVDGKIDQFENGKFWALKEFRAAIQSMQRRPDDADNYAGAVADLDAIVAAYRKRMPDDEWLNLNYPLPPSSTDGA